MALYIEQLYTNCLAEAAYYIESNGEAAVIDPLRETEPYTALAKKRGATIKYIFETHFHADFVSGHIDLARETGAKIVYGPGASAEYSIYTAADHERFALGNISIEVLHTPGHTTESSCFLVYDENGNPYAIFSGDTVFAGDVGRPDLAVKSDLSKEDLAGMLYDSIHSKILTLPDDTIIYPGHGAGSACGKNIGTEKHTTIGQQKKVNYALQPMSKEDFVFSVTKGLEQPPKYFFMDAAINKKGYLPIEEVMEKNLRALDAPQFDTIVLSGATILDTRNGEEFMKGFIPGAINIGLNGSFAVWAGSLLSAETPLLLVTEPGRERETVLRLARVGYENVVGFLKGGFDAWIEAGFVWDSIPSVSSYWFRGNFLPGEQILDVRNPGETAAGSIRNAINIPLAQLEANVNKLNSKTFCYVYCVSGYRSATACSILKRKGFDKVIDIKGGFNLLKQEVTDMVEEMV